ncbi:hypothetical protein DTO027B5_1443 [Paecilomyces variotii]|nr:hypothetical protein DTO021C3_2155 [Paecilomyces variotii]KAJ9328818.1 hypothetical protein DTO027B3_1084 [Paecilomyces variotii]KAJ9336908.1 hypothetical protein DTO027B5_1443 [Paecilomyces variotii]KAJ9395673.1 hypothetical protein DTO282F9_7419 [Paecilomyces variotii]
MANTPEPTKASSSSSSSKQNSTPTPTPTRRPQVLDARALRDLNQQRRTAPRLPTSPEDIRKTPQYKAAARRWTSTIVALPILIYSSYILYERSTGKQQQKHLSKETPSSSTTAPAGAESS